MSGASDALAGLQKALSDAHDNLVMAVTDYGTIPKPWEATDIIEGMQATAHLCLAAEAIASAADDIEKATRAALHQTMTATGCPAVDIAGYRVLAQDGSRLVQFTDRSLIPHNLTSQPPRVPDTETIRKLLLAGEEVPGCVLATGKSSIRFTKRNT